MSIVASVALGCALFHPPLRHRVAVFSVVLSHGQNARAHHIWSCRPPSLKKDNGIWYDYGRLRTHASPEIT